jgi:hypothetical protein
MNATMKSIALIVTIMLAIVSSTAVAQTTHRSKLKLDDGSGNTSTMSGVAGGGVILPVSLAFSPITTLGDVFVGGSGGSNARLGGNTTTTPMFLKSLGNGSSALALQWAQIQHTDVSGLSSGYLRLDGTNSMTASLNAASGITIGSGGTAITKVLSASATLDFPSTASSSHSDLTISVTGAAVGDPVALSFPSSGSLGGPIYQAFVSAADVVTVRFINIRHNAAQDPASGTFRVTVIKH